MYWRYGGYDRHESFRWYRNMSLWCIGDLGGKGGMRVMGGIGIRVFGVREISEVWEV